MNKPDPDQVRDARQEFDLTGASALGNRLGADKVLHRLKVFKSGNSLALRLPKALGLAEGMEMEVELQPDGSMILRRPAPVKQKLDISGFWGKAKGLKLAPRRDFDERPSTIAAREAARKAAGETPSDT